MLVDLFVWSLHSFSLWDTDLHRSSAFLPVKSLVLTCRRKRHIWKQKEKKREGKHSSFPRTFPQTERVTLWQRSFSSDQTWTSVKRTQTEVTSGARRNHELGFLLPPRWFCCVLLLLQLFTLVAPPQFSHESLKRLCFSVRPFPDTPPLHRNRRRLLQVSLQVRRKHFNVVSYLTSLDSRIKSREHFNIIATDVPFVIYAAEMRL